MSTPVGGTSLAGGAANQGEVISPTNRDRHRTGNPKDGNPPQKGSLPDITYIIDHTPENSAL